MVTSSTSQLTLVHRPANDGPLVEAMERARRRQRQPRRRRPTWSTRPVTGPRLA